MEQEKGPGDVFHKCLSWSTWPIPHFNVHTGCASDQRSCARLVPHTALAVAAESLDVKDTVITSPFASHLIAPLKRVLPASNRLAQHTADVLSSTAVQVDFDEKRNARRSSLVPGGWLCYRSDVSTLEWIISVQSLHLIFFIIRLVSHSNWMEEKRGGTKKNPGRDKQEMEGSVYDSLLVGRGGGGVAFLSDSQSMCVVAT